MGFFNSTSSEQVLTDALLARQGRVRLENCVSSVDSIFKTVLKKEPRLLAFLGGYESSYKRTSLLQLMYDYNVNIKYQAYCPDSIDDVIIDNGEWDIASI